MSSYHEENVYFATSIRQITCHHMFLYHRHGIRQLRSGWADGPAYVTQCPIQTGQSYVYNYTITGQRGTLFWHAHISWLRATVYGPLVILPKPRVSYPFPHPYKEVPIVFGNSNLIKSSALVSFNCPRLSAFFCHLISSDKTTFFSTSTLFPQKLNLITFPH